MSMNEALNNIVDTDYMEKIWEICEKTSNVPRFLML